jgi:hypothetical protein
VTPYTSCHPHHSLPRRLQTKVAQECRRLGILLPCAKPMQRIRLVFGNDHRWLHSRGTLTSEFEKLRRSICNLAVTSHTHVQQNKWRKTWAIWVSIPQHQLKVLKDAAKLCVEVSLWSAHAAVRATGARERWPLVMDTVCVSLSWERETHRNCGHRPLAAAPLASVPSAAARSVNLGCSLFSAPQLRRDATPF